MNILKIILYQPLFNALIFIYNIVPGHDMGVAIIILSVIIRLILWPWQAKALRAQKNLQKLQPELQKLQKKYKDKQKQAQVQMEFYKKHKVSPFSSCLPTLVQFPIIIALYQVFRNSLNIESLKDLYPFIPAPETLNNMFFGVIDLSQPEKIFLPVITGGLQFVQSWMMMKMNPASADPSQRMTRQITYIFPIITVIIAMSLPAALPLYWIVTTLFAILQQWLIMREEDGKKKITVKVKSRK